MFFNKSKTEDEFHPYDYKIYNNITIDGYKAFDEDMSCINVIYQQNKQYICFEEIHAGETGFHFCKNLIDCFNYYPISSETIICKVSAFGKIIQMQNVSDRSKPNSCSNPFSPKDIYVTNNIYIGDRCSNDIILEEILKFYNINDKNIKQYIISKMKMEKFNKQELESLINDINTALQYKKVLDEIYK